MHYNERPFTRADNNVAARDRVTRRGPYGQFRLPMRGSAEEGRRQRHNTDADEARAVAEREGVAEQGEREEKAEDRDEIEGSEAAAADVNFLARLGKVVGDDVDDADVEGGVLQRSFVQEGCEIVEAFGLVAIVDADNFNVLWDTCQQT